MYKVTFKARKVGAIGLHGTEHVDVTVQAENAETARVLAFEAALQAGVYNTHEHLIFDRAEAVQWRS